MLLRRAVTVKVIVTEQFREEAVRDLEDAIQRIEQSKSQLDFRTRMYVGELQRVDLNQAAEFRQRMEGEKRRLDETLENLRGDLEEIRAAAPGEEHTRGQLEGQVDLQVGDDFEGRLGRAEIILRDGVVVEIRDPAPEPEPEAEAAPEPEANAA